MQAGSLPSQTRREVLLHLGAVAAATSLLSPTAQGAGNQVHGRVLNRQSGAGLPGVMVSNGRDVVVTGSKGAWTLPASGGDTIFVIKPAQWSYTDAAGMPQFSKRVDALAGIEDCTFYLEPRQENAIFEVALLADTQAANAQELDYVRREIEAAVTPGAYAFAINHGDLMGDDLRLLGAYRDIVSKTGMLWHHCPGNHDMDLSSTTGEGAFATWRREVGPTCYAFQYGEATFILLNNVEYLGAGAEPLDGRLYRGRIGADQLTFVRNVLGHVPDDQLVVVSMHIPLTSFENPDAPGDNTSDRAKLMDLLSRFPHTVSFSGHSHTTEHHYLGAEEGFALEHQHHHHVLTAFCGSWWGGPLNSKGIPVSDSRDGSPRGFHVLCVDGNRYATRFVPLGDCPDRDMRIGVDDRPDAAPQKTLLVDVFDGGPKTKIRCSLPAAQGSIELTREAIPDPHIVESYARHRDLLKPWVSAAPSSHIWTAPLPARPPGEITLHVTNEYGVEKLLQVEI